jgi:23S rRNA (cytosine1962-C5)-methyltransferase
MGPGIRKEEESKKMNNVNILTPNNWRDYELIDSGGERKLERLGQYTVIRPDPRAIWNPMLTDEKWKAADATFVQRDENDEWQFKNSPPTPWEISFEKLRFQLRTTNFKHLGVFPEQAVNWEWLAERATKGVKVLNLFAYTGGATEACALAGAHVTHVDSSRPSMMWASDNMKLAGVDKDLVRWIQDDAMKFVQREIRRGVKYDGIIMDPPRFGRGANGEIWKLEDNLPELVWATKQILSDSPLFFLINAYTADLSPLALKNLLEDVLKSQVESGELGLKQSAGERILPAGIFARWRS